jgi:hypothetical protein
MARALKKFAKINLAYYLLSMVFSDLFTSLVNYDYPEKSSFFAYLARDRLKPQCLDNPAPIY